MSELELKLSLSDQLAAQAQAAGLLSAQGIKQLIREALRKEAGRRLLASGQRLREAGGPAINQAELEAELKAVRAKLRVAQACGA